MDVRGRVAAILELGMGFHPEFSGRQNVMVAGQLLGLQTHEVAAAMPAVEEFAEIGRYFDEPVRTYSSGMHVRLAFSIATGLSLGLISYTLVKVGAGRFREVSPLLWILTVLFILRYIYLSVA